MRKIISLFQRNYETDRLVRDEVTPGAEWVVAGEGVATIKRDGTCCMVQGSRLFKRYDAKRGKTPPEGFVPAQEPDEKTGHWPGWMPVGDGPEDRWHREAFHGDLPDGTYELCGPKIQANAEGLDRHVLIRHGSEKLPSLRRDFEGLKHYMPAGIEGVVWHHPDGRMVKIKSRDFGDLPPVPKISPS